MDSTENLYLPYILPSQAQKHLTHNEALIALDALVQLAVTDAGLGEPPAQADPGERYIVADGAAGEWAGRDGNVAAWQDGAWRFYEPNAGWLAHDAASGQVLVHDGTAWTVHGAAPENLTRLGVGTVADDLNRLAVAASGSLFTHAGADHRMTINRNGAGDTASLLFQTGWSGRAEFGLAGSDAFSVRVSADGETWLDALRVDPASGAVDMPQRPAASAFLNTGWHDAAAGDETGFSGLAAGQGGFALGAAVGSGPGSRLVVPRGGLYQVVLRVHADAGTTARICLADESGPLDQPFTEVAAAGALTQDAVSLAELPAGAALAIRYQAAARCYHASGHTQLSLVCL